MTPYQLHVQEWKECDKCEYSETRNRVCLVRGSLPCELLFIGEAPGESENAIGRPFVGPAGKLLDSIVSRAVGTRWAEDPKGNAIGKEILARRVAYTNLVGCIPRDSDDSGNKSREPDSDAIEACAPRLRELVRIASPSLIVCVGKLASVWVGEDSVGMKHRIKFDREIPTVTISHPAAILRSQFANRGLMIQKAEVIIAQAIEEVWKTRK